MDTKTTYLGLIPIIEITVAVNYYFGYHTQMAISGNQLKAARALAGLDQKALAERAGVGINTIRNFEAAGANSVRGRLDTLDAIIEALKSAGVIFVAENGDGPGVRLRKAKPAAIALEDLNASNDD